MVTLKYFFLQTLVKIFLGYLHFHKSLALGLHSFLKKVSGPQTVIKKIPGQMKSLNRNVFFKMFDCEPSDFQLCFITSILLRANWTFSTALKWVFYSKCS